MKNVTTNESLRNKWNARQLRDRADQSPSKWDLTKHFYFGSLPKSRLTHYFKLKEEAIDKVFFRLYAHEFSSFNKA